MKKLLTVAFSAMAACLFAGNTYYADASMEASGDGLTPETAKKTIQEAVDLCATSGDTVKVAEGLYDEGVNAFLTNGVPSAIRARVIITNKVHLVATGAKEKTIITGAFDPDSETGYGKNAVRGVYIYYTGSGTAGKRTAGSIIEGFTICNAASYAPSGEDRNGGGISMYGSYAVNCIISNCVGRMGGAFHRGMAIRCLVADCRSTTHGSAGFCTTFLNCVIVRNDCTERLFSYVSQVVNCTIAGNVAADFGYTESACKVLNTVFTDNGFKKFYNSSHIYATNCVFGSGTTNYKVAQCANIVTNFSACGFAAPAIGDWRPSAEMGAAKAGDAELLKVISLPADLEGQRYLDYYGNEIPRTGAITCGAAQEVCAAGRSLLTFKGNVGWEIDGFGSLSGTQTDLNYIWTDDSPGMFKVRKAGAALTNLVWYTLSTNGTSVATLYPTLDNWTGVATLPGATNTIASVSPSKALFVDSKAVEGAGDGSAANPYATIQEAIAAAPNGTGSSYKYSVIVVRAGEYKTGGTDSARVHVANKKPGSSSTWWYKYLRIVAEDGPGKTFIVGGAGEDANGYGTGSLRCFYSELLSLLQGFTLTGGHKSGSGASGSGAAFSGNSSSNGAVSDCIISNNVGSAAIAYRLPMYRCRLVDNKLTSSSASDVAGYNASQVARAIDCEIVHSPDSTAGSMAMGAYSLAAFSSVNGLIHPESTYYASILTGGQNISSSNGARYCFAHGDAFTKSGSGVVESCKNGKSRCLNFAKGDFRLRDDSPALGMVAFDPVDYLAYATLDMDGNPLKLDSLAGNTAGAHQKWSVHYEPLGLLMIVR